MPRLIVIYNPRSSKYASVEREVLAPARELKGWVVGKYEVKPTTVEDNATCLAKILENDDLVVVAGGDGTASIGLNGVLLSKKKVEMGVLGYGNFNDMARMGGAKNLADILNGESKKIYPLEIQIDGKYWRSAACYLTLGLFAESTQVFDEKKTREKLRKKGGGLIFSLWTLAKWYFVNKKRKFLPDMKIDGGKLVRKTTDLMFVNSRTMAKVMKTEKGIGGTLEFLMVQGRLGNLARLCWFMLKSFIKLPGEKKKIVKIVLEKPAEIGAQIEGEYARLKVGQEIIVKKAEQPILLRKRKGEK